MRRVTGVHRASLLALVAVLASVLWAGVFMWLRRAYGTVIAFFSVGVAITSNLVQVATYSVRPDLLLALLVFGAAISYGEYLEKSEPKQKAMFWILAVGCLCTHGRGVAFFLLPAIVGLIRRGPKALRASYYFVIVGLIMMGILFAQSIGQSLAFSPRAVLLGTLLFPVYLGRALGWPFAILAAVGGIAIFRDRAKRVREISLLGAVLCLWGMVALVRVSWSPGYLICIVPILAVLFGAGWRALEGIMEAAGVPPRITAFALATLAIAVMAVAVFPVQHKFDTGFHKMLASALPGGKIILVAASPRLEGALISELALQEKRPEHIVLRASKVLSSSTWVQNNYRLLFEDEPGVARFLDQAHVSLIVLGPSERAGYYAVEQVRCAAARYVDAGTIE